MKYSKKIVKEICKLVSNGVFNKDAAICVGISEETFYRWQREKLVDGEPNPEYKSDFCESLKKAEAERKKNFILIIAQASTKQWQAAAWYLERVYRDQFSLKQIQEHKGEIDVEVKMNPDDLDKAVNEAYEKFRKNVKNKPDKGRTSKKKFIGVGDSKRKNSKG